MLGSLGGKSKDGQNTGSIDQMTPKCTQRHGETWTAEDRDQLAEYLCAKYAPFRIGTGVGGMRWDEFCRIPARFPGTNFDRPKHGWEIVLERLQRGFDPAKRDFDSWIAPFQILASLEGKRPDCLDRTGVCWTVADRAEIMDYLRGNRQFFTLLIVSLIRKRPAVGSNLRIDRLHRWNFEEIHADEFREVFNGFDPGYAAFEGWWLAFLRDWFGVQ